MEELIQLVENICRQPVVDFSLGGFLGDIIGFFVQLLYCIVSTF